MNKEIKLGIMANQNPTPLEALEKCEWSLGENGWLKYRRKDIEIIKKALKQADKEQKAFKIIVEKDIDVWLLMNCDYDNYCRIRTKALEHNMPLLDDMNKRESVPLPTVIEFDLVKKVVENYAKKD